MSHPLKQIRDELGLTLEEAGSIMGCSAATVSRIETGLLFPRPTLLRRILKFAARHGAIVTADDLLTHFRADSRGDAA